jgi:hypothetical protein
MTFAIGQKVYCHDGNFDLKIGEIYEIAELHAAGEHVRLVEIPDRWWVKDRFRAQPWWKMGDYAKVLPKEGSILPIGSINKVVVVHPSLAKVKLEPWNVWVSTKRLKKVDGMNPSEVFPSFFSENPVAAIDVPSPPPPVPSKVLVLNAKAKKAGPPKLAHPSVFSQTPLWATIGDKIPPAWRDRIYLELREIFYSGNTEQLNTNSHNIESAFHWDSTSQGFAYWNTVCSAVTTGNWNKYELHCA